MVSDIADVAVSERRGRIIREVSRVLGEQGRAATEMQAVVEESGLPLDEVNAEFPDLYDLVVAVAEAQAEEVSRPLRDALENGIGDIRVQLLAFGFALHKAYLSVLTGCVRVAITEGSRQRAVRKRIYEAGPGAVTAMLQRYLERASAEGRLHADNLAYAAEALMGLLREPLYQELTLHSQEFTFYSSDEETVETAVDVFLAGCGASEARV